MIVSEDTLSGNPKGQNLASSSSEELVPYAELADDK